MINTFFNSGYQTFWTALGSIGQLSVAFISVVAVCYSVFTFKKTTKTSSYREIDKAYFNLLNAALGKTHLRIPGYKRTPKQKIEYDIYAFMVWNFIESIYDNCMEDSHLSETWFPVIDVENKIYGEWFLDPVNTHKFKYPFYQFIRDKEYLKKRDIKQKSEKSKT